KGNWVALSGAAPRVDPSGRRVLVRFADATLRVFDVATGRELAALKGHADNAQLIDAVWTADGARVVSASYDGTVRTWDAASGRELGRIGEDGCPVWYLSGDGRRAAEVVSAGGGAAKSLRVWDVEEAKATATIATQMKTLDLVSFSPDASRVTTSS